MNWRVADVSDTTYYGSMHAGHTDQGGHCIITTTACTTNAFDSYYNYGSIPNVGCLGTTFIRNSKGALAYLGCSRASIFKKAKSNRPLSGESFDYEKSFYKYLFADSSTVDKNYARIVAFAKADYIPLSNYEPSFYRWIQYGLNPLGDPEMPIFTTTPSTFSSATIAVVTNVTRSELHVNSKVENSRICVMSADDDGESYYVIRSGVHNAVFENPPKNCNICITKQNYIPKQFRVRYIQDEEIIGINDDVNAVNKISGDIILVGEYVNGTETIGKVTFKSGRIHLDSNEIIFDSGVSFDDDSHVIIGK